MSSKIELQEPYKSLWKVGYLRVGSEGRKMVYLFNSNSDRTSTSYARYLFSVNKGRMLEDGYEVDHIDGDKTNDCLSNLQALTVEEHREKTRKESAGRVFLELVCDHCNAPFLREKSKIRINFNKFCSRRCNALYSRAKGVWLGKKRMEIPEELLTKIGVFRREGMSDYKISDELGIDRSKIWRLRQENGIP